uniref:Cysteine-rich PDZ-binding protein n=1 Tax=Peromyscus maniculatus bairdii TaxID=230844 RepID=A0A8C8UP99_PERMB
MACENCERKPVSVPTPDPRKHDAKNTTEGWEGKRNRKIRLSSKKARFPPHGKDKFSTCRMCRSSIYQPGSHYCQGYRKDICGLCGRVTNTKNLKKSYVKL